MKKDDVKILIMNLIISHCWQGQPKKGVHIGAEILSKYFLISTILETSKKPACTIFIFLNIKKLWPFLILVWIFFHFRCLN